jgi:hypothetical protein
MVRFFVARLSLICPNQSCVTVENGDTLLRHQVFLEDIKDYISCVMSGFILRVLFHIHWYSNGKCCTRTPLSNMAQLQS